MDQEPMKERRETDISPAGDKVPDAGVDPRSFILPNKEVHDPLNAQRTSAGKLYAQEQSATLPKAPAPPPLPIVAPQNNDSVRPLETYQSDVEKYIREQNISTVQVAAAEEKRRQDTAQPIEIAPRAPHKKSVVLQIIAVVCGILFIVGAGGAFIYAYVRSQPLPQQQNPTAPFIAVDTTTNLKLSSGDSREGIMQKFADAKSQTHLSVGLVVQLKPWIASSTGTLPIAAQIFLSVLTPNMPPELLRTIQPEFLMGVHSFETNQPFLLFSVDSYQGGYAGMLAWEKTMQRDLSPFFDYTPTQRVQDEIPTLSTTTQIISSPFTDTILENHDTRAIKNSSGDTVLLWTFLDRATVLVTTNPNTVHEIISRLKAAPQLTVPGH